VNRARCRACLQVRVINRDDLCRRCRREGYGTVFPSVRQVQRSFMKAQMAALERFAAKVKESGR
jgi:hypothetical protein